MKRRLFTAADVTPTEALLRKGLGTAMDYYYGIVSKAGDYRKQWQYSRGNGWILKVDDTRKALYYLTPLEDGIEVSLTVREAERELFLKDEELKELQPLLEGATRYPEGFALRFDIESAAQYAPVARFLTRLMEARHAEKAAPPKPKAPRKAAKKAVSKAAPKE
jgi:hypothetical protein